MAFGLNEAEVKAALDGCAGELLAVCLVCSQQGFHTVYSLNATWSHPSEKQTGLRLCEPLGVNTLHSWDHWLGANGVEMCVSAADSFDYKVFFKACGLASKSSDEVKKAFGVIDQDNSGFIEEEELK